MESQISEGGMRKVKLERKVSQENIAYLLNNLCQVLTLSEIPWENHLEIFKKEVTKSG